MVQIDYDREMVFIANAPRQDGEGEETLGTVRTWTDADNLRCEFAVMVDDRMKGEGLGVVLMQKMIEYCRARGTMERSEEHTSELQSRPHLVCRLLLEKKKPNMADGDRGTAVTE